MNASFTCQRQDVHPLNECNTLIPDNDVHDECAPPEPPTCPTDHLQPASSLRPDRHPADPDAARLTDPFGQFQYPTSPLGRPGGAQAKFLTEVGHEEQKRNLGLLLDEIDNYQRGIRPAGPHAKELIDFFDTIDGKLTEEQRSAPKIILNDQELRRMLAKRAKTLHLGVANYCWFTDPGKALCLRLAGTPNADRPLIGMCDSARCPQATHHPCHRPIWEQTVTNTTVFLGNLSRGQATERTRLEAQLARAQRVLADIDAASSTEGGQ